MRSSLFFKLLGAFAAVIVVLAAVVLVRARQATEDLFRSYSEVSGQLLAQQLAPALSGYYQQAGTWDGVAEVVDRPAAVFAPARSSAATRPIPLPTSTPTATDTPTPSPVPPTAASLPMGRGMMGGMQRMPGGGTTRSGNASGMGLGPGVAPETAAPPGNSSGSDAQSLFPAPTEVAGWGRMGGMQGMSGGMGRVTGTSHGAAMSWWATTGQRVVVTNQDGRVVSDSNGELQDQVLPQQQLASGAAIKVGDDRAGTVLVSATRPDPSSAAGQYLAALNRSILLALAAASVAALLLGGLLFFSITAPLRRLQAASRAVAAGDLSQRVSVKSKDEIGALGTTFNSMADSLARSESQRRQMMADLAHELRTPLSVIQGNLEAMQDGILPLDGEQVASLHEEALLLGRLVADLRLLSLAEAGQLRLELAEVAPSDLLRKAVERLQQAAQDRHIALSLSAPDALPAARLDADRINQVVGNLVGNSLRHTPAGGAVKVEAGIVETSRASDGPAPALLVKVTDSGSGVAPEELQSIFERFYRSDKSRSRSSGGSGLGLAIVKQIVELHGGKVWAESPVARSEQGAGYGTAVSFTLPLVSGAR